MAEKVILFSCDLQRWNAEKLKVTLSLNLYFKKELFTQTLELDIENIETAVEQTVSELIKFSVDRFDIKKSTALKLKDEELIIASIKQYFERVQKELNISKNNKNKNKSSLSRYNLFYMKETELNLLSDDEKYLAYMDIIERKASKEQFNQIGSYIKDALKLKPDDEKLLKYLSKYYLGSNNDKDAVESLEAYIKVNPNDMDTLTEYARLCDKIKDNKRADNAYKKLIEHDPQNLDALVRSAQLKYYNRENYIIDLDKIRNLDSNWLKEYLKKHWDFKLPETQSNLNYIKAASFLGLENFMDILVFAFNGEIPATIDDKESKVLFNKEELEQWYQIISRYDLNEYSFHLDEKALQYTH